MKIGICTDSSSGLTKEVANKLGIEVIPIPFNIDGIEYLEDDSINREDFFKLIAESTSIHTSQPSITMLQKVWDKMLKEYEQIIYMPITSGLSSSCNTASIFAEEDVYKDKVFVINNEKISVLLRYALDDCKKLIDKGYDAKTIKEILEKHSKNTSIYIMVSDLTYLQKGGRLNPLFAAIGNIIKIKPILYSDGGKFGIYEKARTIQKTEDLIMAAIEKDIETKFINDKNNKYSIGVAYTSSEIEALNFRQMIIEKFHNITREIIVDELSFAIACHIGPGALAAAIYKNIDEIEEE